MVLRRDQSRRPLNLVISRSRCVFHLLSVHAELLTEIKAIEYAEPRISLGIPIIGSPSTLTLLSDRALTLPAPSGPLSVSAPYFPKTFLDLLKKQDPDQVPMSVWKGRKLLVLSGEDDALVNFVKGGSETFIEQLKKEGGLEKLDVWVQPKT